MQTNHNEERQNTDYVQKVSYCKVCDANMFVFRRIVGVNRKKIANLGAKNASWRLFEEHAKCVLDEMKIRKPNFGRKCKFQIFIEI